MGDKRYTEEFNIEESLNTAMLIQDVAKLLRVSSHSLYLWRRKSRTRSCPIVTKTVSTLTTIVFLS